MGKNDQKHFLQQLFFGFSFIFADEIWNGKNIDFDTFHPIHFWCWPEIGFLLNFKLW